MVKGNNTVKNNKSVSFQPYDVSNSLVKKVTSRVSELLHQPAWIGKWLAMPSQGTSDYDTGDSPSADSNSGNHELHTSAEDELLAEQPPAKRARVPFSPQYSKLHKLTFPSPEPGTSIGQGVSPIVNHNKIIENNLSMPGPSNRMGFVSSTPQVSNCVSNPTESSSKTNINGDDNCSDSSESTSGCSSLVPQDNQFKKGSSNINVSGETSNLSRSRIQHSRMNPNTLAARRPSFNASSFIASSKMGPSPNTSPFYSGRTMYGGASHYRRCAEVGGLFSPTHHSPNLAIRPAVSPCRATAATGMSATARRILDALEQFSTPVLDAKRIPLKKQSPKTDERVRPNKRKMSELSSSIPTTPDLLRLKRKERLQDSTLAARHLSSTYSTPASDYSVREDDGETYDSYKGKIKTKRKDRDKVLNVTPLDVNLPNVSFGVSELPKIDIALPPKPSPISKPISLSSSSSSSVFKFSKPSFDTFKKVNLSKSNLSESTNASTPQPSAATQSSNSPSFNFMYKPSNTMPKEKKSISIDKSSQTPNSEKPLLPVLSEQQKLDSAFGKKIDSPKNAEATVPQSKTVSTLFGSVSEPPKKEEVKTAPIVSSSGFGDKFKKPEGSWECSACLIQNKPDASKCIACETPKPSSGNSASASASSSFPIATAFGTDKAKMPESLKDAPSTSSNSSSTPSSTFTGLSSFGDKFKKPEGAWECGVCMVQNKADVTKCVACETVKPGSGGSTAPALKTSGFSLPTTNDQKFNFGVDKANEPKFNFGINKADTNDKPVTSGFKLGDNGTATIGGAPQFSFGVPSAAKSPSKATPPPAFKFNAPVSAEPKKIEEPKINFSAPTPPKTALDVTDSQGPPAKKSAGFANPFSNVDVKQSMFDNNKNITSPVKSQASPLQPRPELPSFSAPTSTSVSEPSKTSPMPSSNFTFGNSNSAFSIAPAFSSSTNQRTVQPSPQSQKAVQDMKIESTSSQPNATSSITLNHSTTSPKSTFLFKPALGGFSFGGAATDKPKESVFGNTDKPKESVFGNVEIPKDSVFGNQDKPKAMFGSTEAPKESIFGSTDKPQTSLFGNTENKTVSNPQIGNGFGTSTGGFAFGNPTSTSSSNTFSFGGSKPAEAAPAAPTFGGASSNPSVFGFTSSSEAAPVSASPFGGANKNSFSSPFQSTVTTTAAESKPVFSFGGAVANPTPAAPVGGFSFNAPAVNKPQGFNFSTPQTNNATATGGFSFGGAAAAAASVAPAPKPEQSSVFMFKTDAPQQNNVFGNSAAPAASPFGAPANPAPSFGAPAQPSFSFGANSSAPASQPIFAFGGQNANAAPSPVFGGQPANAGPTFNPNIPTSFNFTGGAPPSFSATPTASVGGLPQRRIKKAVRRTQR